MGGAGQLSTRASSCMESSVAASWNAVLRSRTSSRYARTPACGERTCPSAPRSVRNLISENRMSERSRARSRGPESAAAARFPSDSPMPFIERKPVLLGRAAVRRRQVQQVGDDAGFARKRAEPEGPELFVLRQQALIEDDDDGLVLVCGIAEESFHGRIVVLLLCENGHQHVGGMPQMIGPQPVDFNVAVDVGRVQHQQVRRQAGACLPEEPMLGAIHERGLGIGPLDELEPLEDRRQIVPFFESLRYQTHGMPRARSQRTDGAHPVAGEVIENDAFADVRPPHDGGDDKRLASKLGKQLAMEGFIPFAAGQRAKSQDAAFPLQLPQGLEQSPRLEGNRVKPSRRRQRVRRFAVHGLIVAASL